MIERCFIVFGQEFINNSAVPRLCLLFFACRVPGVPIVLSHMLPPWEENTRLLETSKVGNRQKNPTHDSYRSIHVK